MSAASDAKHASCRPSIAGMFDPKIYSLRRSGRTNAVASLGKLLPCFDVSILTGLGHVSCINLFIDPFGLCEAYRYDAPEPR
jgi:hypothetical protein